MTFQDRFGHRVELTTERWHHITAEHPELHGGYHVLQQTLAEPERLVRSVHDSAVVLYYRFFPQLWHGKFVAVVVKRAARHFILTAYVTDSIKGGTTLWPND